MLLAKKLRTLTALVFLLFGLSGCIYPIYKTLQPNVEFAILDESRLPVSGAEVTLSRQAFPYGQFDASETLEADTNGHVRFRKKSEWRQESLMIHGAQTFYWHYAVSKQGYEATEMVQLPNQNLNNPIEIILSQKSKSN